MARTGGRSTGFSWFVGILIVGVVGALVWLAVPAFPSVAIWIGDQYRNATGGDAPAAEADEPAAAPTPAPSASPGSVPADCAGLYPEPLWALLTSTAGAQLAQQSAVPETEAELAAALGAARSLVCHWSIPTGPAITTVVAAVAADAPDTAATYLGARRFACTATGLETVCSRDADGRIVTHVVRGGIWATSTQDGWRPPGYADAVSERVWSG